MDAPRSDSPLRVLPPPLPSAAPDIGMAFGMIVLYFVLQALIAGVLAAMLGFGLSVAHRGDIGSVFSQPQFMSLLIVPTLVIDAAIMSWLIHRQWPQRWSQAQPPGLGFAAPEAIWYVVAAVLGLIVPLIGGALTQLLAQGHQVTQDVRQMGAGSGVDMRIVLTLTVISVGPLIEELLFRGVLLSALLRRMRVGWAIAATALLFGLVHLPDFGWAWYGVPDLALLGAALAWLRLRSDSLWPAVLAHACNNLLSMLVLFVGAHHP